ncbi:hypothetical protein GE09DRAFT_362370 [Coniochaeta sp. 2T2.1]|nr:hypothetical protein GE09DRAFT_362370 [Coniochaeta sp. 2T2.1]
MELSGMTGRWSLRTKQQEAERVRENQRRHRARTKAYIADIERRLSETEARLNDALMENSRLTHELEKFQPRSAKPSIASDMVDADQPSITSTEDTSQVLSRPHPSSLSVTIREPSSSIPPKTAYPSVDTISPSPEEACQAALLSGAPSVGSEVGAAPPTRTILEDGKSHTCAQPASCHAPFSPLPVTLTTIASSQGDAHQDNLAVLLRSDCSHLPPPMPGESTIPCKTAYRIMEQQNYNGLELATIRGFLTPGFRGATVEEEGCRVESNRVFSILDLINN